MNKSTLVAKATLHTFVKWSKWYTAMFIGIFLVIVVLLNHLSTYDWSLLQGYLQSTRIFFLILGLMSMRGFLEYFVSNGVTRKDYFKGLASASARLAIVMTIAGLILYGLERLVYFVAGWEFSHAWPFMEQSLFIQTVAMLSTFFLFYLLGWFISAGYYKFNPYAGFGIVMLCVAVVIVHNRFWGLDVPDPVLIWSNGLSSSPFISVLLSAAFIAGLLWLLRQMTKNMEITA